MFYYSRKRDRIYSCLGRATICAFAKSLNVLWLNSLFDFIIEVSDAEALDSLNRQSSSTVGTCFAIIAEFVLSDGELSASELHVTKPLSTITFRLDAQKVVAKFLKLGFSGQLCILSHYKEHHNTVWMHETSLITWIVKPLVELEGLSAEYQLFECTFVDENSQTSDISRTNYCHLLDRKASLSKSRLIAVY